MFIYQWFERIGNVVAPDESYQEQQQQQQHESPLFAVVAPDPNFATPHKQHSQTENETVLQTPDNTVVQCQHCRRLTPSTTTTTTTTPSLRSTPTPRRNALVQTPTGSSSLSLLSPPDHIQQFRLHQASQQTELIKSPRFKHKDKLKSFFYLVADPLHFKPKKDAAKIRKFLQDYPHWLLEARTSNFGTMVENGYTPLQAAAHCNHLEACKILLEHHDSAKEQLLQTTVSGKTALHIATEKGHVEVATLLVETMKQLDLALTVVDVMQRTPLGMALSSPEPKAYSSRKQVLELLYQPDDPSILGDRAPLDERCFTCQDHTIVVAHSDMPGMRVDMEDAMLLQVSPKVVLLGVLDGHGDGGQCSAFCAQELETELTSSSSNNNNDSGDDNTATMMMIDVDALTQAFLAVDDRLAKTTVPGGSTGVVAVIHDTQILVANGKRELCFCCQGRQCNVYSQLVTLLFFTQLEIVDAFSYRSSPRTFLKTWPSSPFLHESKSRSHHHPRRLLSRHCRKITNQIVQTNKSESPRQGCKSLKIMGLPEWP